MPTPLILPDCLMRTYEWLYPTIDFTLVKFYVGLPAVPVSPGAITVPDAVSARGVGVYLNGAPDFCSEETFLLIAHELVHVLQMQQQGGGLGLFRPFTVGYYTCATISGGSAGRDNPYEREAYDYANGPPPGAPAAPKGRLRQCIDGSASTPPLPMLLPCSCTGLGPRGLGFPMIPQYGDSNYDFKGQLLNRCPDIQKRNSTVSSTECIGRPVGLAKKLGSLGAVIGVVLSVVTYVVAVLVSVVTLIVSIVAAIISIFVSIGQWVAGLFSSIGVIKLMFTENAIHGLGNTVVNTGWQSAEPPALAASATDLYIGWTGTDQHPLNVVGVPSAHNPDTFEIGNPDSGPALLFANNQVVIVWQDRGHYLHMLSSNPTPTNFNFTNPLLFDSQFRPADNSTPVITFSGGRYYLAWISRDNNHVYLSSSPDTSGSWDGPLDTGETTIGHGTPAIAFAYGRLYLSLTADYDHHHLYVASYGINPDGSIGAQIRRTRLDYQSSGNAGPALASGDIGGGQQLYLAWVDQNNHLNFAMTTDDNAEVWLFADTYGYASDRAAPALCVGPGNLVCVAWIDDS